MLCQNVVSKTQMIRTARQNANSICLKERSSGVWLEEQIRVDIHSLSEQLSRIETRHRDDDENKKCFLPVLNKFILIRTDQAKSIKTERVRKVIQLLCIVLLRIKYRMHAGALGILMYVGVLLEEFEPIEYTLGAVVYSLIRKVSMQISMSRKSTVADKLRHNRGSFGNAANCPLLYNIFREKMEARLRKSQLIVEKTFAELIHNRNESLLKLPEEIHPDLLNYLEITVNIDRKSLIFSYEYPKVLENFVPLKDYRFFISKLNTIIVPQARCYGFPSILRIFYNHISGIFLLLCLLTTIFVESLHSDPSTLVSPALFITFSILILALTLLIFLNNRFYKNPLLIHKSLSKVIASMTMRFWEKKTVFRLGDSIQCFYIYIDSGEEEEDGVTSSESEESSKSEEQGSDGDSHLCSLKQFFEVRRRSSMLLERRKSQLLSIKEIPNVVEADSVQEDEGTSSKKTELINTARQNFDEGERRPTLPHIHSQRLSHQIHESLHQLPLSVRSVKSEKPAVNKPSQQFEFLS